MSTTPEDVELTQRVMCDCEEKLTLARLRSLSTILMIKNKRNRFESRNLCRSNTVEFLESNLMHTSKKIRYLALQLLCCTIPRLADKTDYLLEPFLPKIFQCLRRDEDKDIKLVALHFLRGYFRHTKKLLSFIERYVRLGIENSDVEIQTTCCLGLNIVFDQVMHSGFFIHLAVPLANLLLQRSQYYLIRTAYQALKHIHSIVGEEKFLHLIYRAYPEAREMFINLYNSEKSDSYLSLRESNCTILASAYQIKRRDLNLNKDFGILDPKLLDQLEKARNGERAPAVYNFAVAVKRTKWADEELYPHATDFLRLINAFVKDSHQLIQLGGLRVLKQMINKMGFVLSPQIRCIVEILRPLLTSVSSNLRTMAERVLHRLMCNVHPMTVVWQLLRTRDTFRKEAILLTIQEKLDYFPYYEFDTIDLCNFLGKEVKSKKSAELTECCVNCITSLFKKLRDCPACSIRTEAISVLLKNHYFSRDTLREMGILENFEEDSHEEFECHSEEEMSDFDAARNSTVSTSTSKSVDGSMTTAAESEVTCKDACSNICLDISCKITHKGASDHSLRKNEFIKMEQVGSDKELPSGSSNHSHVNYHGNFCQSKVNSYPKSPDASSLNESLVSYDSHSAYSRAFKSKEHTDKSKQKWTDIEKPDCLKRSHMCRGGEISLNDLISSLKIGEPAVGRDASSQANSFTQNETAMSETSKIIAPESVAVLQNHSGNKTGKTFTQHFSMKKGVNSSTDSEQNFLEDRRAGGDADVHSSGNILNPREDSESNIDNGSISESDNEDGVRMIILDPKNYNFNIMRVEHHKNDGDIFESGSTYVLKSLQDESLEISTEDILEVVEHSSPQKTKKHEKSDVCKSRVNKHNYEAASELPTKVCEKQSKKHSSLIGSNFCKQDQSNIEIGISELMNDKEANLKAPSLKKEFNENSNGVKIVGYNSEIVAASGNHEDPFLGPFPDANPSPEVVKSFSEVPTSCSNDFEENQDPFEPKSQLRRTPIPTKNELSLEAETTCVKKKCKLSKEKRVKNKKIQDKKSIPATGTRNHCEDLAKKFKPPADRASVLPRAEVKARTAVKNNLPTKWGSCQWKRELEYAAKAGTCSWADTFDQKVESMKPFPPKEVENEMEKAFEDLNGRSWLKKEEAMLTLIGLARHHPQLLNNKTAKIVLALSTEIQNFRQSVSGKAVVTVGYMYELMGKSFETTLPLVLPALLAKSGNRTLAAHLKLVVQTLFKITSCTSPKKAVLAFILEGSKHSNKAARETAAQFITVLTDRLSPDNILCSSLSSPMLKCAAQFVTDRSALIRYCGKRMFKALMNHLEFDKIIDHQLDKSTFQNIENLLSQIRSKGFIEETLPINVIY